MITLSTLPLKVPISQRTGLTWWFVVRENGAVEMDDKTRKTILVAYQERKREEIHHRFLNESVTVGALLCVQARLLARWLRGDLDAYPTFFWK